MENPSGAVSGNSQNTPTANVPRTFSTFDLKYHLFDTHRFGEYHPHYVEEGVKNDVLPIRSSHNVMSYTLKSPLMQNITMKKDYFNVPMEAILPLNWEKFFDNPVRGDDVPNDVGPTVENFWSKVGAMVSNLSAGFDLICQDTNVTRNVLVQSFFRFLIFGEYFYSNGSLMASLGCHGAPYASIWQYTGNGISTTKPSSWDKMFDIVVSKLMVELYGQGWFTLNVDGYSYSVSLDGSDDKNLYIPLRHALQLMRDNPNFTITNISDNTTLADGTTDLGAFIRNVFKNSTDGFIISRVDAQVPFNLSRLWAYQLVCAHYYSNDHIDFVYSAELYRQLINSYVITRLGTGSLSSLQFTRNGVKYFYDSLSAKFCAYMFTYVTSSNAQSILKSTNVDQVKAVWGYISALFGYRRSLRYQDYFTGSRAQPLAVGSTGVSVSGNTVDVVDVTRNIQRQRFLNAVNRVRHNFEGYLHGIFGGDVPAPDYHNPFFLASTEDSVYGQETENTADAQMLANIAITSNLRSNGSRYMLEIRCDRPSVIIGITHYDLPRVYGKSMEREFLHVDRFDMFNPFMQFIGDQPIYYQELGTNANGTSLVSMANFAYSLRHMEYKQRFNQACGGFVEFLPGFAFLACDDRGSQTTINPDWIRSVCSEFDDFYVSLTGYSNGSYFHFIVDNFNDCTGTRPMAYAPSIL